MLGAGIMGPIVTQPPANVAVWAKGTFTHPYAEGQPCG